MCDLLAKPIDWRFIGLTGKALVSSHHRQVASIEMSHCVMWITAPKPYHIVEGQTACSTQCKVRRTDEPSLGPKQRLKETQQSFNKKDWF